MSRKNMVKKVLKNIQKLLKNKDLRNFSLQFFYKIISNVHCFFSHLFAMFLTVLIGRRDWIATEPFGKPCE